MILAGVSLLNVCLSVSLVFCLFGVLFVCFFMFFLYIHNTSLICYYRWPALMDLGPSGSLPYRYYSLLYYYILAINSVCVFTTTNAIIVGGGSYSDKCYSDNWAYDAYCSFV